MWPIADDPGGPFVGGPVPLGLARSSQEAHRSSQHEDGPWDWALKHVVLIYDASPLMLSCFRQDVEHFSTITALWELFLSKNKLGDCSWRYLQTRRVVGVAMSLPMSSRWACLADGIGWWWRTTWETLTNVEDSTWSEGLVMVVFGRWIQWQWVNKQEGWLSDW